MGSVKEVSDSILESEIMTARLLSQNVDDNLRRVGVIGLGVVGGSLARRLAACGYSVTGYDVDPTIRDSVIGKGIGWAIDSQIAIRDADIVVLAVPADAVPSVLGDILPALREGQILTDVSSVKVSTGIALFRYAPSGVVVVGGHPMAGSALSGWVNSDPDLFAGCTWVLCPPDGVTVPIKLVQMVQCAGTGRMLVCTSEEHDRAVAAISHAVQVSATVLAGAVATSVAGEDLPWQLAAGGWRDTTRIADSNPEMWIPILTDNAVNVIPVLNQMRERLTLMIEALEENSTLAINSLMLDGRDARGEWREAVKRTSQKEMKEDIPPRSKRN